MSQFDLPASLLAQLRRVERRLYGAELALACSGAALGLLGAWLGLFALDRVWETPAAGRCLLLLAAVGGCGAAARFWGERWLWRRRGTTDFAQLVQRRYPALGDRLQGILELAEGHGEGTLSPALCRAAIRQVAGECERFDFREAVPLRRARRLAAAGLVLAVVAGGVAALLPEAAGVTWTRLLLPYRAEPRFTFTRLAPLPERVRVAHGEAYTVEVALDAASRWRPASASARLGAGPVVEATRGAQGVYSFPMPAVTSGGELAIRAGDVSGRVPVEVVHRPALEGLSARCELPAYLQQEPREYTIDGDRLTVPAGSRVRFTGQASRALASAAMTGTTGEAALTVEGASFSTGMLAADALGALAFTWVDVYGFGPGSQRRVSVVTEPDRAPTVATPELASDLAVLVDETLTVPITAEDDFGVRQVGVNWQVRSRPGNEAVGDAQSRTVAEGEPSSVALRAAFGLNPKALGIAEKTVVELRPLAWDYVPGREPSVGQAVRIYVLSRAEHAQLVRQQLQQLQARLEEVLRAEEALLAEKLELRALPREELAAEAATARLKAQEFAEKANAAAMEKLAEQGLELMQEAMRNRDFPTETFEPWSKLVDELGEVSRVEMPELVNQVREAREAASRRDEELKEAIARQEEMLAKLEGLLEQLGDSLESVTIRNFVARLREAGRREKGIESSLVRVLPTVVGLEFEQLPEAAQALFRHQAASQREIQAAAGEILHDLDGFNLRLRSSRYLAVQAAMTAAGVPGSLAEPAEQIEAARTGQAIQLAGMWAERFEQWANMLDRLSRDEEGGEGQEGQSQEMDARTVLALLRLLQEETNIRATTRTLERQRETLEDYADQARELAGRQLEAFQDLGKLEDMFDNARLDGFFHEVGLAMMDAAVFLGMPRTDIEPIAAETEAIELLASLIAGSSQQLQQSNPSLAALMMQMLGMMQAAGNAGTGNPGAYASSTPNREVDGPADSANEERHGPERASGLWIDRIPVEFREALEGYYRQLEEAPR